MAETHNHEWRTLADQGFKTMNGKIVFIMKQICECGVFRFKDFINIDDNGDAK